MTRDDMLVQIAFKCSSLSFSNTRYGSKDGSINYIVAPRQSIIRKRKRESLLIVSLSTPVELHIDTLTPVVAYQLSAMARITN
jgi:hypothetical protein